MFSAPLLHERLGGAVTAVSVDEDDSLKARTLEAHQQVFDNGKIGI